MYYPATYAAIFDSGLRRPTSRPRPPPGTAILMLRTVLKSRSPRRGSEAQLPPTWVKQLPIHVAVVSFGYAKPSGHCFLEVFQEVEEELRHYGKAKVNDLRTTMQDPHEKVAHGTSIENNKVVRSVCQQTTFADTIVEDLRDMAMAGVVLLGQGCRGGNHRGPTVAEIVTSFGNAIVVNHKGKECRLFNCMHFRLSDTDGVGAAQRLMSDAFEWVKKPWMITEGGDMTMSKLFGYDMVKAHREAAKNWMRVYAWVKQTFTPSTTFATGTAAAKARPKGTVAVQVGQKNEAKTKHDSKYEEFVEEEKVWAQAQVQEPAKQEGTYHVEQEEAWHVECDNLEDSQWGKESQVVEHESLQDSQRGEETEWGEETESWSQAMEPWASFDATPEAWKSVLDEHEVDTVAQQELFLLSQHSEEGWKAANSVLGKLLKKSADGAMPRKPSAFVHTCVQNARHLLG